MMARTYRSRATALAAGAALALAGAPAAAQAGEMLVVGGGEAPERVENPFLPDRAATDLGPAPRVAAAGARAAGVGGAATPTRARAARRPATSARVARRARARAARTAKRARQATSRALRLARQRKAITPAAFKRYRRIVMRSRSTERRLRGARRAELGNAIALVDGLALRRRLTASRLPATMLILRRNAQYWPKQPFPPDRAHVSFRGSRLIFEYYSGNGLQLQPLVNFKQANLMHGACVKESDVPCDRAGLATLLAELSATAATRGGFKTWEYYFEFGGGIPPWISGMAQATAIQAFARAWELLGDDAYLKESRAALGAFRRPAPVGVRTKGPFGGVHYLQYSYASGLYIINAFMQALIGLYDYSEITGNRAARRLFHRAEPEVIKELAANDLGDWTTYSYRGSESTREYHELVREFAASMCSRLRRAVYCDASRSFLSYMTDPAELELLGPAMVVKGQPTSVRFSLSKLAAVQLTITHNGKTVFDQTATFRHGQGSFAWTPRAPGVHRLRLAAKELRTGGELRSYANGVVESAPR